MRSLLPLLLFMPVLMGSTCKASYSSDGAYVKVCNAPGSPGACAPGGTHPPTGSQAASLPSGADAGTVTSAVVQATESTPGDAFAATVRPWRPVASPSSGYAAPARAIPEPSAALAFGLGWLGLAWRLRARRR
jgi:hypothetical protein